MRQKLPYLIALILLAVVCLGLSVLFFGRSQGSGLLSSGVGFLLPVAGALGGLALAAASRRVSGRVWLIAGLLILAGLFIPTSLLVDPGGSVVGSLPQLFQTLLGILLFLLPSLALVVAAFLLQSGLNLLKSSAPSMPHKKDLDSSVVAAFLLGALLIAKTLDNLYWLMVWDNTSDGLGYIWLALPVLAAFFSGVVLAINLPGWSKLAGLLYALLIPTALIAVSTRGLRVEYRQLTEERAGRVSQAVEAYYARNGRYPQDLRQLVPFYMLSLPKPVIINGQGWCYRAGEGYYQLGYVYREHWSSPILIGRVSKTAGEAPAQPPLCEPQINVLRSRFPGFYGAGSQ